MLLQRVTRAAVRVDGRIVAEIGPGVLVFLGVERGDTAVLAEWFARRVSALRLFPGESGVHWERTVGETGGQVLVVSQFTLAARTRKGRRPSFDPAAPPEEAVPLYQLFNRTLTSEGLTVAEGVFGAMMAVELVNDGPVTFLVDGPEVSRG